MHLLFHKCHNLVSRSLVHIKSKFTISDNEKKFHKFYVNFSQTKQGSWLYKSQPKHKCKTFHLLEIFHWKQMRKRKQVSEQVTQTNQHKVYIGTNTFVHKVLEMKSGGHLTVSFSQRKIMVAFNVRGARLKLPFQQDPLATVAKRWPGKKLFARKNIICGWTGQLSYLWIESLNITF